MTINQLPQIVSQVEGDRDVVGDIFRRRSTDARVAISSEARISDVCAQTSCEPWGSEGQSQQRVPTSGVWSLD